MKLRIKGNSVRMRLTRSEVAQFAETGKFEESSFFGPSADDRLTYAIERSDSDSLSAAFRDGKLTVLIPADTGIDWTETETVGIEGDIPIGSNGELHILIEKDFVCLTRDDEDPNENYPHPKSSAAC